jgi:hypothetical protein
MIVPLHEIWKVSEYLSSSQVTLYFLAQIVHKYFKVLSFEASQNSCFTWYNMHEFWKVFEFLSSS